MKLQSFLLIAALAVPCAIGTAADRPNILLIYSDDHGWADLGAQGVDKDIQTPNLDQLASDGVRFSRGYVSAPQCVPSRAGLLTGRYQQKFGVEDNNKGPLPLAELTVAERLKEAGYVTGMVGKWHLDSSGGKGVPKEARQMRQHAPHGQGFDEYWRGELKQYYASHDLNGEPFKDAPRGVVDNRFRIVVQTEAALSFLKRRTAKPEQPWFLYLAWFAPHVPLDSPEPWFSKTPDHLPNERRQALAMIAAMDDGLGRIRAKLQEMGAGKRTLIFFIGDNGAPTTRGAWNGSLNTPLIGEKGMLTDGGTRTPFVAAWPGTLPAGRVYEQPVINLDVAATAVALSGLPRDGKLDGVNLMPFLTGRNNAAPHERLFWRWRSQAAVLEFPWKLVHLGDSKRYLFNITAPEGETQNLLTQRADIAARLESELNEWSATLQPPGPPEPNNEQDSRFFAIHVDKTMDATAEIRRAPTLGKNEAAGAVQGWLCRNGALAVKDGALTITPDDATKQRCFITHSNLDLPGPVKVVLRVRGGRGGSSSFTWRTKGQDDFVPDNQKTFDWPTSSEWQSITSELPIKGRLIHLRVTPGAQAEALQIQAIELCGAGDKPQSWHFDAD